MIDPEAITVAKRALGRQLAAFREAAGLKQQDLAPLIHYGRSTVANAETGRSTCSAAFWEQCDQALAAGGALLGAYNDFKALVRQHQADVAHMIEQKRTVHYQQVTTQVSLPADQGDGQRSAVVWLPGGSRSLEPGADAVVLHLRLDGREVAVPLNRHLLLQAGIGTLVEAFVLGQQFELLTDAAERPSLAERAKIMSPAHLQEILVHLGEQWHALVKTDNLLGPRFALAGVLGQIDIVEALLPVLQDTPRTEAVALGAMYAESAAWLYEDSGNLAQARYWTSRAMEWAYEADDKRMLAWTVFRRSQQVAAATRDAARVIGLAQAARRDEEQLATPTRAAIRVQEAYGYALDGDEHTSQTLIDEAHTWAAGDTVGDAHEGHGSYCTPSYIEIQRANCWLATGKRKKAITLYEDGLRTLPPVYQRNHAQALSWLAAAYAQDGQLEQAATTAHAALPVARSSGSRRTVTEIKGIGAKLAVHRSLPAVAALLDDLGGQEA